MKDLCFAVEASLSTAFTVSKKLLEKFVSNLPIDVWVYFSKVHIFLGHAGFFFVFS